MTTTDERYMYKGFKLISLVLNGNPLMGKVDLSYEFVEQGDSQNLMYTTVIIGPNGTGKSNLLKIIIELFKELNDLKNGKNRSYNVSGNFRLKYSLGGDIFEYTNFESDSDLGVSDEKAKTAFLLRNSRKVEFAKAHLPQAIVANSIMLTDKFPFYRKETDDENEKVDAFPIYKYLGVRHIPQSASTRAYVRRTIEFIVDQFGSDGNTNSFLAAIERALIFLELSKSLEIYFYTSNTTTFFTGEMSSETLENYFEPIRKKYPKSSDNPPFKLAHYLRIKSDEKLIKRICKLCNDLVKNDRLNKLEYKGSSSRKIIYELFNPVSFENLSREYVILDHLRKLGIITAPEIKIKRNSGYTLQESSSGEYHFLSSVVGLIATIRPTNSLILIDEPEISLHPNWQMKYLEFIRELFGHSEYSTCHMLVATHSHFLVSDLKSEASKIIGLRRVNNKVSIVDFPKNLNTYGRSAEEVLFRVFSVPSNRNHYFELSVARLLELLYENDKNKKSEVREIVGELRALNLSESDPLNEVMNEAELFLANDKSNN